MTTVTRRVVQPLAATATRLQCRRAVSLPRHAFTSASFIKATTTATMRLAVPQRRTLALVVHSAAGESSYYDPDMPLTPRMKKHLRGHANALGSKLCVHQVGKNGVTDTFMDALRDALAANELVKVKVGGSCLEELEEVAELVTERLGAEQVGSLGNTFLMYKMRRSATPIGPRTSRSKSAKRSRLRPVLDAFVRDSDATSRD